MRNPKHTELIKACERRITAYVKKANHLVADYCGTPNIPFNGISFKRDVRPTIEVARKLRTALHIFKEVEMSTSYIDLMDAMNALNNLLFKGVEPDDELYDLLHVMSAILAERLHNVLFEFYSEDRMQWFLEDMDDDDQDDNDL